MDALRIGLSGMHAAQMRLGVSAHNTANLTTRDFRPQQVSAVARADGGTQASVRSASAASLPDLARETVAQISARSDFAASARVVGVAAEMRGQLIDLLA